MPANCLALMEKPAKSADVGLAKPSCLEIHLTHYNFSVSTKLIIVSKSHFLEPSLS